jgi:hypothetical protein
MLQAEELDGQTFSKIFLNISEKVSRQAKTLVST